MTTRNSGSTCDQHTTTETDPAKTQTTSPLAARCQRFSPRWSAVWAPHHLEQRPRRRQSGGMTPSKARFGRGDVGLVPPIGGIARHGGPTRRRHAAEGRHVVQNPPSQPTRSTPRRLQDRAGPLGAKKFAQHRPSGGSSAKKLAQHAQTHQIWANLSARGELFRAFTI